jgi:hypothetical protein
VQDELGNLAYPVMDGHDEAVEHYSDVGRVFFSRMFDVLQKRNKLNALYRAGQLATMAFRFLDSDPRHHRHQPSGRTGWRETHRLHGG